MEGAANFRDAIGRIHMGIKTLALWMTDGHAMQSKLPEMAHAVAL